MSVALSSSSSAVLERTMSEEAELEIMGRWEEAFEVERVFKWVLERGLETVVLQFPDGLLRWAPRVAHWLEGKLGQR